MMKIFMSFTFLVSALITSSTFSNSIELLWEIKDLANPESVVYDDRTDTVFVSNQNYSGKDGEASIGKLSIEGVVLNKEWVKGLNEPKGIAISGDRLFVSDVKSLVEISIEEERIIKRYEAKGANALNDVVINEQGEVFVSDMFNSSIYKLEKDGQLKLWLESPELENPNGLLIVKNNLIISAWGSFNNKKPLTASQGNLIQVNMKDKSIKNLTNKALGNLDGIQVYKNGQYLVSDWVTGDIYLSNETYDFKRILNLEQSSGDIAFIQEEELLLIPMAKQGKVLAYKIIR